MKSNHFSPRNMFKRIKRFIALTKKDPKALQLLENLTKEQLEAIPEALEGDGKAVFFGQGTDEEHEEFLKEEEGMKPWYDRLRKLDDEV